MYAEPFLIGKSRVLLRPSVRALCAIEKNLKCSVVSLLMDLHCGNISVQSLRIIVYEMARAAGVYALPVFEDVALQQSIPELQALLLRGIGCAPEIQDELDMSMLHALVQPNWQDIFISYVGILGRPIYEFWEMTLAEYALVTQGFCLQNNIDPVASAAPATSHDLIELMQSFPDDCIADTSN